MSSVVGLDEAGVGSLMGIMVAGAVILPTCYENPGLNDSKKLTDKKRKILYEQILENAHVGIGVVTNEEIDELGLGHCRVLVFHRALDALCDKGIEFDSIIVDGNLFKPYKKGDNSVPHSCIPKADATVPCVSAASIIAKHYRDEEILKLCAQDEVISTKYDWKKNKGYPAPKHLEGIKKHGIVKYHRKSYGPCKV